MKENTKKETVEVIEAVKPTKALMVIKEKPALKIYKADRVVNVRFEPSMTSNVIGAVARDETIEALEEKDDWIRFIHGWTKKEFYTEI